MSDYVIYKHTSPSGKSYIGQTKHYDTRIKWMVPTDIDTDIWNNWNPNVKGEVNNVCS